MLELGDSCEVVIIRVVDYRGFLIELLVHSLELDINGTVLQVAILVFKELVQGSCVNCDSILRIKQGA